MVPVRKVYVATHFKAVCCLSAGLFYGWNTDNEKVIGKTEEGEEITMYTPCEEGDEGAMLMTWRDVPPEKLREPDVSAADIFAALEKVKPTVGPEETRKCQEWTEKFGSEGA